MSSDLAKAELRKLDPEKLRKYAKYIKLIKPRTPDEVKKRWHFAFLSTITTWQQNVKTYKELQKPGVFDNKETLRAAIRKGGCGKTDDRTDWIWQFNEEFDADPDAYSFSRTGWAKNDRLGLSSIVRGLGMTKVSFAAEMINPSSGIVCLDRHTYNWITGNTKSDIPQLTPRQYLAIEKEWVESCEDMGYHPIAARHHAWDLKKKQSDMTYWSHVFEKGDEAKAFDDVKKDKTSEVEEATDATLPVQKGGQS